MNEENKQITIMECSANYSLCDETEQITAKGEVQIKLGEENISLLPKFGEPLFFFLRDILEIFEDVYKIHLTLTSKENSQFLISATNTKIFCVFSRARAMKFFSKIC